MKPAPHYLTTDQLSYMWGVTKKTVIEYTKGEKGWLLPAKVAHGKYDANIAHRLYIDNKIIPQYAKPADGCESLDDARRRKEIALANLKELQESQQRGELIPKDQAIQWIIALVSEAKTALMALPRRLAPVIYGATEIRDIENTIRHEIVTILNKLSRPTRKQKRVETDTE